jgi:predicted enzyme related to lactoylglutathione lyase
MKSLLKLAALTLLALPALAVADVSFNGVRITGKDPVAIAKFYMSAFGMQEVQRIENPQMLEIMLNFGATPAAAQANRTRLGGSDIVVMKAAEDTKDTTAHVVLNVTDMDATVKALKAAGGKMEREPFVYGGTIRIGMAIDPAGNHIELIQGAGQSTPQKK